MSPGPPGSGGVESIVVDRLLGFAQRLRQEGLPVGSDELMRSLRVLDVVDLAHGDSLFWGLRLSMVRRHEDLPVFDAAFERYWRHLLPDPRDAGADQAPAAPSERSEQGAAPAREDEEEAEEQLSAFARAVPVEPAQDDEEEPDDSEPVQRAVWSDVDVLVDKDFEDYTVADHERLLGLLAQLTAGGGPLRVSRRKRQHRRGSVDIRRTVRAGFRTEGSPMRQLRRRPQLRRRRLAFVCDVSGSMERYSRAVLELAYVALRRRWPVEAFAFATHLTRVTGELLDDDADTALSSAAQAVVDWSGGTRVGACFHELNRQHRSAVQGAVVVVASDGWDLGDPERLAAECELLHRRAHSLIWVNPHLKDPAFEPLTRGMSAALPQVDHFLSCHNYASFVGLLELLETL